MGKTMVIAARKGGVGKTMTAVSLGIGLARQGKRALIIDADTQHSATVSLGFKKPDGLAVTRSTVIYAIIEEADFDPTAGIIHHAEGVDLLPANSSATDIELALAPLIGRETVLRQYIEMVKPLYDYILIDTSPTQDLLLVNALVAADSVIVPIVPKLLDAKGLELLLKTVAKTQKAFNPALTVDGILLTMVDGRTSHAKEVISLVENAYGGKIRIFAERIPRLVRAADAMRRLVESVKQEGVQEPGIARKR